MSVDSLRRDQVVVDRSAAWNGRRGRVRAGRSLVGGVLCAALLSCISVVLVTHLWSMPMHVPFQYTHTRSDDQQDATLDLMLIKDIHETGWFNANPHLNAPFEQRWAEWPMGGDLLGYTLKKVIVDATGDVPLTFNLFWLLTFPLTAIAAFPALRSLRCSWSASVVGALLFSLAPYHFRNGAAHENLAFYVSIPASVLLCVKVLGPDAWLPSVRELRHRSTWWRLRWLLAGAVLIGVTGIYYLAFFISILAVCALGSAVARRRADRLVLAALFGSIALGTSVFANLPTLLYRWQHPANLMAVPARQVGDSEFYPLRIVELLSPVTGHRFAPFASLADFLQEPGRQGLATANLGWAAAVGFVVGVFVVLVRAIRGSGHRWALEARLGIVMLAALFLATKGGLSRVLELVGLDGVRAWNRIAIVIAFAGIAVFGRLLDRLRYVVRRRRWSRPRLAWCSIVVVVAVVGVLDQAAPLQMPHAQRNERLWHSDGAFVTSLERQLPANAMVFQLPVVDFPDNSSTQGMSDYDLIKEGYLHSRTLRWSAGGIAGRDGEWQWPASLLPVRDLVRGLIALGFSALTLDRFGYPDSAIEVNQLEHLLGRPIATSGTRLVAWKLLPAGGRLLAGVSVDDRRSLARSMLDAPRLYLSADADPLTARGSEKDVCASASLTLVNPGMFTVRDRLEITLHQRLSGVRKGYLAVNGRRVAISATSRANTVSVVLPPGTTRGHLSVTTAGVRCGSVLTSQLPSVSAYLDPLPGNA